MSHGRLGDFPRTAGLEAEVFRPLPTVSRLPSEADGDGAAVISARLLSALRISLETRDDAALTEVFLTDLSYWRDSLALTYHLRTFRGCKAIAKAFRDLNPLRQTRGVEMIMGSATVVSAEPSLSWVECRFTFRTTSPRATCGGRMMIIPECRGAGLVDWKIWVLSTWLAGFDDFPADEGRLKVASCAPRLAAQSKIETDVVIVGAGNSGLILAARLKALGVNYVLVEKNEKVGDNWALRYDTLRFHTGNGFGQTPYLPYPDHVPVGLRRDDLAGQMRRFAMAFALGGDVLHSTTIRSTYFDPRNELWTLALSTDGKSIQCRQLVLCTGIGSWAPELPNVPGRETYQGVSVHSSGFRSGGELASRGVQTAVVVGSANTGFDVMEDCYNAGIKTTMIERSPTYIIPMAYLLHRDGFGMFDHVPLEVADPTMFASPLAVGGQLVGLLHASLAAQEPDRYARLAGSGFQVLDSRQANLSAYLSERQGGHFVDMGTGVELLSTGKVGIRAGVSPVAFTARGLRLSDCTVMEADAVIWCTGFRDKDVRRVVPEILGDGGAEIRDRMDGTWGVDAEGEMRGVWKRHHQVSNFYVMGGGAGYQRWYSGIVALQLKAAVEGFLPDAYRE